MGSFVSIQVWEALIVDRGWTREKEAREAPRTLLPVLTDEAAIGRRNGECPGHLPSRSAYQERLDGVPVLQLDQPQGLQTERPVQASGGLSRHMDLVR